MIYGPLDGKWLYYNLLLEVFTQRNFEADFIRLKLNFILKLLFEVPFGRLRSNIRTPSIALGNPVVDFLFVIIEVFSLSLMAETLQAEICRSRRFSKGWVTFRANFRQKGASPTAHCWCQKTRVVALLCGIKISTVHCLALSQSTRLSDRRMGRQTDRITPPKTSALFRLQRKHLSWFSPKGHC